MDPKLLLVRIITLLYKESLIKDQSMSSKDLVRELIAVTNSQDFNLDTDDNRETIIALRATAIWLLDSPDGASIDRDILIQRIRVNTGRAPYLADAIIPVLMRDESDTQRIYADIKEYRTQLFDFQQTQVLQNLMKDGYKEVVKSGCRGDWRDWIFKHLAKIEEIAALAGSIQDDAKHPALVDQVDFANQAEVERLLWESQSEIASDGVIRTAWQGINRMCGKQDGIRRGDCVVIGALQHKWKTGFTTNIFKAAAIYNKPYMFDEAKKPLLVHISFENNLNDNVMQLYKSLKENETGELEDITMVDISDARRYVIERMTALGYHIKMLRFDGSGFTYRDLFEHIRAWESEGYEVHLIACDYLNLMSKQGCYAGAQGMDVRDLFRRVRNYCNPRRITFITPHQLSTQAKELERQGAGDLVKEIREKGYYDSCKTIDQEVDLELYIHKVSLKGTGRSFLTIQRGKHRKLDVTPEEDLYCVYEFQAAGAVRDDILTEPQWLKSVPKPSLEDEAFF